MTPDVLPLSASVSAATATADDWTREVRELLGRDDPTLAFGTIRAVLHALHRRLDADRARVLSDALPTLIRGVFHEPLDSVGSADTRAGFLACVDRSTRHAVRPEEALRAVCTVLASRLPDDAWRSVCGGLPTEIAALLAVPPHPARTAR